MAQPDIEYVLEQANEEQESLPHLDQEWLTGKESSSRQEQHISDEDMRRVQSKQMATEREIQEAERGWNKQIIDNDAGVEGKRQPELVLLDSESEEEADIFPRGGQYFQEESNRYVGPRKGLSTKVCLLCLALKLKYLQRLHLPSTNPIRLFSAL